MGMITIHKKTGRVEVRISGDELIEEVVGLKSGERFRVGQMFVFISATKLRQKHV